MVTSGSVSKLYSKVTDMIYNTEHLSQTINMMHDEPCSVVGPEYKDRIRLFLPRTHQRL